jgi:hypothetical protein
MTSKAKFNSQLGACTRTVNAEIKKTIVQVKAVRTGRMKNTTKVKIDFDFNTEVFTIKGLKTTFYFKFVDLGTIYIKPRNITQKTLAKDNVQKAFNKLYDVWIDYQIDREFEVIKPKYGI